MQRSIRRTGLRDGKLVLQGPFEMQILTPYQWLTTEPDPNKQSWATRHLIPYSRTAYRMTIEIPERHLGLLLDADTLKRIYPQTTNLFNGWAGSEGWHVYHGMIPPTWILASEQMR